MTKLEEVLACLFLWFFPGESSIPSPLFPSAPRVLTTLIFLVFRDHGVGISAFVLDDILFLSEPLPLAQLGLHAHVVLPPLVLLSSFDYIFLLFAQFQFILIGTRSSLTGGK